MSTLTKSQGTGSRVDLDVKTIVETTPGSMFVAGMMISPMLDRSPRWRQRSPVRSPRRLLPISPRTVGVEHRNSRQHFSFKEELPTSPEERGDPVLDQPARYMNPRAVSPPPDSHYLPTPGRYPSYRDGQFRGSSGFDRSPSELHSARSKGHGSFQIVKNIIPSSGGVVVGMGAYPSSAKFLTDIIPSPNKPDTFKRATGTEAEETWRFGLQEPRLHAEDGIRTEPWLQSSPRGSPQSSPRGMRAGPVLAAGADYTTP